MRRALRNKPVFQIFDISTPIARAIFETDDEEKIVEYVTSYYPELKMKIVPLLDNVKMTEAYQKMYE